MGFTHNEVFHSWEYFTKGRKMTVTEDDNLAVARLTTIMGLMSGVLTYMEFCLWNIVGLDRKPLGDRSKPPKEGSMLFKLQCSWIYGTAGSSIPKEVDLGWMWEGYHPWVTVVLIVSSWPPFCVGAIPKSGVEGFVKNSQNKL
jgi:hypothetical protein